MSEAEINTAMVFTVNKYFNVISAIFFNISNMKTCYFKKRYL